MEQLRQCDGFALARGTSRHLSALGFAALPEFVPERGRRVDLIAVGPTGQIWIVECKSSVADFRADQKWHHYLPWCDRFYWAVPFDFPAEILPPETGLIRADAYDAAILREAPEDRLAGARRNRLIRDIARTSAERLRRLTEATAT